jgi:hypothetical protein
MDNKLVEEKVYELISYMVVSARNLLEEPARYGPFRLVDAASRLITLLKEAGISSQRMNKVQENIEAGKYSAMGPEEEYEFFLEAAVFCVVDGIEVGDQ